MVKATKYVGTLLSAAILLFLFVANFSSATSSFECVGMTSTSDGAKPTTVYIELEEYRWWVGLWSDSDASLHLEVPNKFVEYFGHIEKIGDLYQIFDSEKALKGQFSKLSNKLALSAHPGFFDGACTRKH